MVSDEDLKFPEWQARLKELLLESDREKLPEKIEKVETLIFERLQQLGKGNDPRGEKDAAIDALIILRIARRDKLGHSNWK